MSTRKDKRFYDDIFVVVVYKKFFEYLVAGRPILMTYSVSLSIIKNMGVVLSLIYKHQN